jgi:signal transduction histidine kinase
LTAISLFLPFINLLQWLAVLLSFAVGFYCFKRRYLPHALGFGLFFLSTGWWALWGASTLLVDDIEFKILFNRLKMLGVPFISVIIFYLATTAVAGKKIKSWLWPLLLIIPLISVGIIVSPVHELMINNYRLITLFNQDILAFSNGDWFMIHNIHARIVVLVALTTILISPMDQVKSISTSNIVIFMVVLTPFVIDSVAVLYFPWLRYIQLVSVFFTFSALVLIKMLSRDKLLEVIPLARSFAIDNVSDIILVFNLQARLIDYNLEAEKKLKLNRSHLFKNEQDLLINLSASKDNVLHIGEDYFFKQELPLKGNERELGRLIVLKNVSLQEKINQFKTQLLGVLGHDIQSHLCSINLLAEQLKTIEIKDQDAHIESINLSVNHCIDMINQLLDWSKNQLGAKQVNYTETNVHLLVNEVINFLTLNLVERGIEIETEIDENLVIETDAQLLRVIVRNLLANAIKHGPQDSLIKVSSHRDLESFYLSVEDRGETLDQELMKRLKTNADKSLMKGFGLVVVHDFLALLNGHLDISRGPEMTVFKIKLKLPCKNYST